MDERLMEIKESAIEYLDRFQAELPTFVLELRAANAARLSMLADVIEGAKWLFDAISAITGAVDNDMLDRLVDAYDAMQGAVENLDYILIADILEYEFLELAADWRDALTQ